MSATSHGARLLAAAVLFLGMGALDAHAQVPAFTTAGVIAGPADLVDAHGTRLYAASGSTLRIFEVSDPASPRLLGSFSFPERPIAFAASGSMVYALTEGGLRVLDVANPMSPALRGSFTLRGANQSLMVLSPTVVLTTNYSSGLNVIDVSDPAQPSRIGSYVGDGFARGVTAAGTMAYLTDWPSGLYVLSLVKDRDPEVVRQLRTPGEQTGIEDPRSFTPAVTLTEPAPSAPTTLVSVLDQGGSLHVFDVTKPAAAVETATLRISGTPRRMRTQGRLAFIAAGPAGVHVVDLSNPSKPAVVTQAATKAQAHDVALGESTMFVAAGGDGVIVFRRTP